MIKTLVIHYAFSLIGINYLWGGANPLEGFDCSGLVLELLKSEGKFPYYDDTTSQGLYLYLKSNGYTKTGFAETGCIVFYGKSVNDITHVAYCIGEGKVIEAAGGNRTTVSKKIAEAQNAFVRIRPVGYRKDLIAILNSSTNVFPFRKNAKK